MPLEPNEPDLDGDAIGDRVGDCVRLLDVVIEAERLREAVLLLDAVLVAEATAREKEREGLLDRLGERLPEALREG